MDKLSSKKTKGIYSENGKEIIPVKYDEIKKLGNGYFILEKDSKQALFSPQLKSITGFEFSKIGNFSYHLASVEKTGYVVI